MGSVTNEEIIPFLRRVPLFSSLPDDDLAQLAAVVKEVRLEAGDMLFAEGDPGDRAYIIKDGRLEILKNSSGREVLLSVRHAGEVFGELALLEEAPRMAGARARTDSLLLTLHKEHLDELLTHSPSAARAMLQTVLSHWRNTEALLRQNEKMAQLGTLTAGVAHELNNPAAAMKRSTAQLADAIHDLGRASRRLAEAGISDVQEKALGEAARNSSRQLLAKLDAITRSDREYEMEAWLEEIGVNEGWECAPVLVDQGFDVRSLSALAADLPPAQVSAVISWLATSCRTDSLRQEVSEAATRISQIVTSLKEYSYLDQAPVQPVDVQEGLENTLVMLSHKLKDSIHVVRDYAPRLPVIQAYGSELNQVWTNILDNAADALSSVGGGEIEIRTRQEGGWVVVEISDNGPGIAADIQPRVFDPFFTTKQPGKGTGLGLNISYNIVVYRHAGDIQVYSRPGHTTFQVRLPIDLTAAQAGETAVETIVQPEDDELCHILKATHTIAVVGISASKERNAYTVPAYLQKAGYRIFPVNPELDEVLGERAFPDLLSLPEPIDLVLIFRRSEGVREIAEQAIQIGAKSLWMQEGVINLDAASMARKAGLDVVMNMCMRVSHQRLLPTLDT